MSEGEQPAMSGPDLVRETLARARAEARARAAQTNRGERRAKNDAVREGARSGRPAGEPVAFGAALSDLLSDRGWQAPTAAASVLTRWEELVGAQVAAHSRPVRLHDGELVVEAESTAWATQLRLLSRTLLSRLQEQLDAQVVRKLVIRGPSTPDWRHGKLRVTGGRGPRDTYG